jgi:hypothetical protein
VVIVRKKTAAAGRTCRRKSVSVYARKCVSKGIAKRLVKDCVISLVNGQIIPRLHADRSSPARPPVK